MQHHLISDHNTPLYDRLLAALGQNLVGGATFPLIVPK